MGGPMGPHGHGPDGFPLGPQGGFKRKMLRARGSARTTFFANQPTNRGPLASPPRTVAAKLTLGGPGAKWDPMGPHGEPMGPLGSPRG